MPKRFFMYRQEWDCCGCASESNDIIYNDCPFCERKRLLREKCNVGLDDLRSHNVRATALSDGSDVQPRADDPTD